MSDTRSSTPPNVPEARPHCYRCDKPASMCLCGYLTPIDNTVGVHVLQHPHERRHPLGTARLLRLGLDDVRVHVLELFSKSSATAPAALPEGVALLYPSDDARDLTTLTESERPEHLVVIDGTWTQAHRIFRDNPWISALPRVGLPPGGETSRYRIRREPRLECLSTVESVVAALRILEPDLRGTETLVSAFDAMIDAQVAAIAQHAGSAQRFRVRRRPPRPIPDALLAPDARIVVVYTEPAPRRSVVSKTRPPLRISAVALDGARVFDRVIQTTPTPDAFLAGKMGLELSAIDTARPVEEVMAEFREFCGASAGDVAGDPSKPGTPLVLAAWNPKTFRWFQESMGDVRCITLKGVWANITRKRIPELEAVVNNLELEPPALPVTGRAGARLTYAFAMLRHILDGAADAP